MIKRPFSPQNCISFKLVIYMYIRATYRWLSARAVYPHLPKEEDIHFLHCVFIYIIFFYTVVSFTCFMLFYVFMFAIGINEILLILSYLRRNIVPVHEPPFSFYLFVDCVDQKNNQNCVLSMRILKLYISPRFQMT